MCLCPCVCVCVCASCSLSFSLALTLSLSGSLSVCLPFCFSPHLCLSECVSLWCLCVRVCLFVVCACMWMSVLFMFFVVCVYTYIYPCLCLFVWVYVCMYIRAYTCICMFVCVLVSLFVCCAVRRTASYNRITVSIRNRPPVSQSLGSGPWYLIDYAQSTAEKAKAPWSSRGPVTSCRRGASFFVPCLYPSPLSPNSRRAVADTRCSAISCACAVVRSNISRNSSSYFHPRVTRHVLFSAGPLASVSFLLPNYLFILICTTMMFIERHRARQSLTCAWQLTARRT